MTPLQLKSLSFLVIACSAHAAPVTQRPTFRIDGTERVLFIYTGNLIVSIVAFVGLVRMLMACFGLCCIGNQERIYYQEVLQHVFSISDEERKKREPVDSMISVMRYCQEFLKDQEVRSLAAMGVTEDANRMLTADEQQTAA